MSESVTEDAVETIEAVGDNEAGDTIVEDETPAAPVERKPLVQVTGPAAATGRRKEAIARVRLIPGTGVWTVNGRTLALPHGAD